MNLLIINDSDGHCAAVECNIANLKKVIGYLREVGEVEDEGQANELLESPNTTVEELKEFMNDSCPMDRSGGGRLYFVESEAEYNPSWNPFS